MFDNVTWKHAALLISFNVVAAGAGLAGEEALYDTLPPKDAVFIRFLGEPDTKLTVFGSRIPYDPEYGTSYIALSQAELAEPPEGLFHSVLPDGKTVISEPDRSDRSKVHLFIVNASDGPVRLTVSDGGPEVIAPVQSAAAASRSVNPVSAQLSMERVSDEQVLSDFDLRLRRGQNLTFLATADGGSLIENSFGPVVSLAPGG